MDIVEKFKNQSKKRFINTRLALAFSVSALAISYYDLTVSFFGMRTDSFALLLQVIGSIFLAFAYSNSLCPKCNCTAGEGRNITECKSCGVKLT